MNFNNIRNVGYPQHNEAAVPKSFVDDKTDSLEESIDKKILDRMTTLAKMLAGGLKKRTHIISATASFHGDLIAGDYQFTWGVQTIDSHKNHAKFNGFLVPSSGRIKKFIVLDTGIKFYFSKDDNFRQYVNKIINKPIPFFSLILLREKEEHVEIGTFYLMFTGYANKNYFFKYKDSFDENFYVKQKDIINIRTEFDTVFKENHNAHSFDNMNYNLGFLDDNFYTYLATVLIELDPLEDD